MEWTNCVRTYAPLHVSKLTGPGPKAERATVSVVLRPSPNERTTGDAAFIQGLRTRSRFTLLLLLDFFLFPLAFWPQQLNRGCVHGSWNFILVTCFSVAALKIGTMHDVMRVYRCVFVLVYAGSSRSARTLTTSSARS